MSTLTERKYFKFKLGQKKFINKGIQKKKRLVHTKVKLHECYICKKINFSKRGNVYAIIT